MKSWLIGKDSDAGRDWGQEEKGTTEDEMAGWHHWLDGSEFEWSPGVGDGQGGLACCDSWGRKESDTTKRLNWTELMPKVYCSHIMKLSRESRQFPKQVQKWLEDRERWLPVFKTVWGWHWSEGSVWGLRLWITCWLQRDNIKSFLSACSDVGQKWKREGWVWNMSEIKPQKQRQTLYYSSSLMFD